MYLFDTRDPRLGLIPAFLSEHDPRPAVEQLHTNYAHGGGWRKFEGFLLVEENEHYALSYPGDPLMHEVGRAQLRDETVVVFEYSWVAVIQSDGTYEIARMD